MSDGGSGHSGDDDGKRRQHTVRVIADIEYERIEQRALLLDLHLPEETPGPLPVIVWLHGGGWSEGTKSDPPAAFLATYGYAVASATYRFSNEAPFPAQIRDCKAVVRWVRANAGQFGLDPTRVGAWGKSSGGHLAALLGTSEHVSAWEEGGSNAGESARVDAVCDWCGPTDLAALAKITAIEPYVTALLGGPAKERLELAHQASPLTYVHAGVPPFLIMHGSQDRKVLPRQSRNLHEALQRVGADSTLQIVEVAGHDIVTPETLQTVLSFFDKHFMGHAHRE